MKFTYSIDTLPEKALVGMFVKTNHADASRDCPVVWQKFGPRIGDLCRQGVLVPGFAYGVSVMDKGPGEFTYWAAVEVVPEAPLPEGMQRLPLPGGEYVHCTVPSLASFGEAFTEMYREWPKSRTEYDIVMSSPCFERYEGDWQMTDSIEIYAPVSKKG